MSVSYAPVNLRLPPGFQNLLEGLAREVLRSQPEDLYSFAAGYFRDRLTYREGNILNYSNGVSWQIVLAKY